MSSSDLGEDAAFLLYLVPVVAAIVYGAIDWATTSGATSSMPQTAYLDVSKSPYLFLLSTIAICLAIILEVRSAAIPERIGIIQANTSRLQILAVIVLIISLVAAISAASYNVANGFLVFIDGRYAFIYAFFLIGISLLLSPRQVLGNLKIASLPDILGLLLLVASPVLFWAGLKVHLNFAASSFGGLIVGIIGFVLLFTGNTFGTKKSQPQQVPQKQSATSAVVSAKSASEK